MKFIADPNSVAIGVPSTSALAVPASRRVHPVASYLASLSQGSKRTMISSLLAIAQIITKRSEPYPLDQAETVLTDIQWEMLRYEHTLAIRAQLADRFAFRTANKALSGLKGVLRECFKLDLMSADDYQRAISIKVVRGSSTIRSGRAPQLEEWRKIFLSCKDDGISGIRDAALLAVLYGAGLRRAEAAALKLTDYLPDEEAIVVRHGKGNKTRKVFLRGQSRAMIDAWLIVRESLPKDFTPLFTSLNKVGGLRLTPLTDSGIYHALRQRCLKAGVSPFTPHDSRRGFTTDLLNAGMDVLQVARQLGHSSVQTTAQYDQRPDQARAEAAHNVPILPAE